MKNIHNSMIIDKFRDEKSNGIFFFIVCMMKKQWNLIKQNAQFTA